MAQIEDTGKSALYLRLSSKLVSDHDLKDKMAQEDEVAFEVEVQFQLNRMPIVEMHSAVDKLPDVSLVYPDVKKDVAIPWTPSRYNSNSQLLLFKSNNIQMFSTLQTVEHNNRIRHWHSRRDSQDEPQAGGGNCGHYRTTGGQPTSYPLDRALRHRQDLHTGPSHQSPTHEQDEEENTGLHSFQLGSRLVHKR